MFVKLLQNNVKQGVIHLHMPEGKVYRFGNDGLEAHWVINSDRVIHSIATDWEFQLGETYINGGWDVGDGKLRDLLYVLRANFSAYSISRWLQPFFKLYQQWNQVSRSYFNVSHHYDLEEDFFRLFLDDEMHYSCAYFSNSDVSLEQAQQDKCKHIAAKLLLQPGQRVLDIGCGWGSMAFYLAENFAVEVTGLTLSTEQLKVAQRRAQERGLSNVNFKLQDYREHSGVYDRIVSIGMFEHVGKPNYDSYFKKVKEMLTDDGVALIHTIGRSGPPGLTNPWIRKHIFPGGSVPSLSEMSHGIEDVELMMTDIEILRLHYAQTLRIWQQRFHANKELVIEKMGLKFYRMWD
ncbi:MAG: class I SAM-dependent methyltransferase, partial [Gammaproteobacteria bacterium]|nr:class I SAM-dependent methyltransferase [Gammaproteobacteria bacterium]